MSSYKISAYRIGQNLAYVRMGEYSIANGGFPIPYEISTDPNNEYGGTQLERSTYPSDNERQHHRPRPKKITTTIAGVVYIPPETTVVFRVRRNGHHDYIIVLVAEVAGGKLRAWSKEMSVPKSNNGHKSNWNKLRRNTRTIDGNKVTFYVWNRDQYRFTIRKV